MMQFNELNPSLLAIMAFALAIALLVLLRSYQVLARPEPEMVRKLFHLGGGLLGLTLPWLFQSLIPVLALAAAITMVFVALRTVPVLRKGVGQVLAGVKRKTVGEFSFVASICLLFWLAKGDKLLYGVPLLVLAVADTFAALIGAEYGKVHFRAWKGRKSVEGSATFFLAAFFCVHVPVLLLTDVPRLESLLIAVDLALMVMMAEAAAWWGLDNLIIPVASFALLKMFLPMPATKLAEHLAFLLSLSLFIRYWRNRTTLADDALFGASLWGYMVWALADRYWVVPPLLVLVTYTTVTTHTPHDYIRIFNFPVALANIAAGLVWLLLYRATGSADYFYPFTAAFAANLAIIALVRLRYTEPDSRLPGAVLLSAGKGVLLVLVPSILLMDGIASAAIPYVLAGTAGVLLATVIFAAIQPSIESYPVGASRWLRQAILTTGGSMMALLPHLVQFL